MWFGEAQQFPETGSRTKQDHVPNRITYQTGSRTKQDHVPNRITYQTQNVETTKLWRVIVQNFHPTFLQQLLIFYKIIIYTL